MASTGLLKLWMALGKSLYEACWRNFSRRNCAGAASSVCSLSGAQTYWRGKMGVKLSETMIFGLMIKSLCPPTWTCFFMRLKLLKRQISRPLLFVLRLKSTSSQKYLNQNHISTMITKQKNAWQTLGRVWNITLSPKSWPTLYWSDIISFKGRRACFC